MHHLPVVCLLLAAVALSSGEKASFACDGVSSYLYPVEGSCHNYYSCSKGSLVPEFKDCSWPLLLFRNFDPVTLKCDWCWRVDCSAKPAPPPTAPPTTTTTKPTTSQTTKPTTKPTTTPTTKPPTAATTTTAKPTTAPTPTTPTAPTTTTAKPTAAPTSTTQPTTAAPISTTVSSTTKKLIEP